MAKKCKKFRRNARNEWKEPKNVNHKCEMTTILSGIAWPHLIGLSIAISCQKIVTYFKNEIDFGVCFDDLQQFSNVLMVKNFETTNFCLHSKQIFTQLLLVHTLDGHLFAGKQMSAQTNFTEATWINCVGFEREESVSQEGRQRGNQANTDLRQVSPCECNSLRQCQHLHVRKNLCWQSSRKRKEFGWCCWTWEEQSAVCPSSLERVWMSSWVGHLNWIRRLEMKRVEGADRKQGKTINNDLVGEHVIVNKTKQVRVGWFHSYRKHAQCVLHTPTQTHTSSKGQMSKIIWKEDNVPAVGWKENSVRPSVCSRLSTQADRIWTIGRLNADWFKYFQKKLNQSGWKKSALRAIFR